MREYRDPLDAAHARIAQLEGETDEGREVVRLRSEIALLQKQVAEERARSRVWIGTVVLGVMLLGGYFAHSEVERRRETERAWKSLASPVPRAQSRAGGQL